MKNHLGRLFKHQQVFKSQYQQQQDLNKEPQLSGFVGVLPTKQKTLKFRKSHTEVINQNQTDSLSNLGLRKKSSLIQQLQQTFSQTQELQSENDIDLVLKAVPRLLGRSNKIVDGTELVKEIVKETIQSKKQFMFSPKGRQKSKYQRSKSKRKRRLPSSRQNLLNDLKKKQRINKSSQISLDQLSDVFKTTNLQEIKSKNQKNPNYVPRQCVKTIKYDQIIQRQQVKTQEINRQEAKIKKKQKQKLFKIDQQSDESVYVIGKENKVFDKTYKHKVKQEQKKQIIIQDNSTYSNQYDHSEQNSKILSQSSASKNRLQKKVQMKKIANPKNGKLKKKKKSNKYRCPFLEYQAEQSDSVSQEQQTSSEEEEGITVDGLFNDDAQYDQKNQDIGYAKAQQIFQKQDEKRMLQMIQRGFKKKSIPKLIPSEKIKQNQRKKEKEKQIKHLKTLEQIIKIQVNPDDNKVYLPQAPKKDCVNSIADQIYEEEKQKYEMQMFLKNQRKVKQNQQLPVPIMLKKRSPQFRKRAFQQGKSSRFNYQIAQNMKRGSLIGKKVKRKRVQNRSAVGGWTNHLHSFLNQGESIPYYEDNSESINF